MDDLEIAHRRLANQWLTGMARLDPVEVVRHFGAMQSQEFAVAKWSVGQRCEGADDAAIQKLIDSGAILRTHTLRPTWHFVAAEDIGWMQALTGPRVNALTNYYHRQHGIDDDLTRTTNRVITQALSGGNNLTRAEVSQALAASKIEATGARLGHLVMRAELDGLIANGPMRGKQHTYALISERAPDRIELPRDEALRELTIRYFISHGPATIKDFAWWASLTVADVKHGLAMASDVLACEEIGGVGYWFAPSGPPRRQRSPSVHVLAGYDEYLVAYTRSRRITNIAGLAINTLNENTLIHAIVLDSQVIGYWRRIAERGGLVARPHTGRPLTGGQRRAVDQAFGQYARFAGVPVTVSWPPEAS